MLVTHRHSRHLAPQRLATLLDDLVGALLQDQRHVEAERLRGLQVHRQLELGGLLHRQVRRLGTFKDAIDVLRRTSVQVGRQGLISSHCKLRLPKAKVVSVAEKPGRDLGRHD